MRCLTKLSPRLLALHAADIVEEEWILSRRDRQLSGELFPEEKAVPPVLLTRTPACMLQVR